MDKKEIMNNEYIKFVQLLTEHNSLSHDLQTKKIYFKISYLIYLSRRHELKSYFKSDYFEATLSFLIEGYIALVKNIPNGSKLLLRSAIENYFKYILDIYGIEIHPRRFKENCNRVTSVLQQNSFISIKKEKCTDFLRDKYSDFSKISHSATQSEKFSLAVYYSDSIILSQNSVDTKKEWLDTLERICIYSSYQCSESFKQWDYNELNDLLKIAFSKNFSRKLSEYFIDGKEY